MSTKKYKQKLMKHRICKIARIISCASFLVLAIIGVSSLVRAMSLESVANQNGIPAAWQVASLGSPETITVPITYWDQRQDDCSDPNRQFEWSQCTLYAKGVIPNIVQSQLGSDGLPVPTYNNNKDAWAAYHDVFTANVIGHNPVQTNDNFYRWFHEAYDANGKQLSKRYDREVTFNKVAGTTNTYTYGSHGVFPLDDVDFSKGDKATSEGHNFHFTAHLQIPMKISADGTEQFKFLGDDDVWVFLNGQLVLDLGGLHMETAGSFTIDANGNVQSTVDNVNTDQACRQSLPNPLKIGNSVYNAQLENKCQRTTKTTTIHTNFQPGEVVNLDFFYAERSTSESNTTITITNMNWPISADSDVNGKVIGKLENSESNIVEYVASIKNRDPQRPLDLQRFASYIQDSSTKINPDGNEEALNNSGFIPLDVKNLYYTTTPNDTESWQPLDITPPLNSNDGFKLNTPLHMTPSGQQGDTLYFRYYAETSEYSGNINNIVSFYTELDGTSGVTYDHTTIPYTGKTTPDLPDEPDPKYTLSIEYRVDFGEDTPDSAITDQLPPTYHQEFDNGAKYDVPSKEIPGYLPDKATVTGTIDGSNVHFIVTYTKKPEETPTKHRVVIHYVYTDGSEAAPDYRGEYALNEPIYVESPTIPEYTYSEAAINTVMSNQDLEFYVYYAPVIRKHMLVIHYRYTDGSEVYPDYIAELEEGASYSVNSTTKDGYTYDKPVVSGNIGTSDLEIIVTYTPNSTPVNPPIGPVNPDPTPNPEPDNPTSPVTPDTPTEDPNLPVIPLIPNEDGDNLLYLPPLGEVVYVPNTGIISDFVAPLFDQYFAEVVLSQGFVLAMLLIFAGSFATYFSLRQYLHFTVAVSASSTKQMPKPKSAMKSSTRSPRASASTSRSAAKRKAAKTK